MPAPLPDARRNRHALLGALLVGAAVRAICAWLCTSFVSRDDYFHVLQPAQMWLHEPSFNWHTSGLPGAGYRSYLLPKLVYGLLRALVALGVHSPVGQLRGLYMAMGLHSLALVPLMFMAGRRCFDDATGRRAAWVGALFFVLPFAGTRLLLEAMAMPPLLLALCAAHSRRGRSLLGAGACLSLACWWRLQVASVLPGLCLALWPRKLGARRWALFVGGGLGVLALQAGFDMWTVGSPLAPLWRNLAINLQPHAQLSRSAPWGYVGFLLLLSLPPASVWLLPSMAQAARRAPLLALPLLSFVLFHCLVPHKEDRFLLPVVPIWGVLLAAVPSVLRGSWPPRWQRLQHALRRSWPVGRSAALGVGGAALLLAITSQSQLNLQQTMTLLRQDPQARGIISLGPELQTFFLERPTSHTRQHPQPSEAWLLRSLAELQAQHVPPNRFVTYASDRQAANMWLRLIGFRCQPPTEIRGWWGDRLLLRLNPRRNRRRGPTLIYRCEPGLSEVARTLPGKGLDSSLVSTNK